MAGFYDGEGHTSCNNFDYVKISIAQVDRSSLDRVQAITGVGLVRGPRQPKKGQPFWEYRLHGFERCQHFIAQIWPWLGEAKRSQATAALLRDRAVERRRSLVPEGKRGDDNACWRGHLRSEEGVIRTDGKWACRKCNRDNARRRRGSTGVGYIEQRKLNQ